MPAKLKRSFFTHRWVVTDASTPTGRDRGQSRISWKQALCYLGVHGWVTATNDDGERYLKCRRCGKFGGTPGSFNWVPNRTR